MANEASDSGQFGYGQQDPNASNDDFNKISFAVKQIVNRMETMKLVKVMKVTPGEAAEGGIAPAGTVDVLPLVNQVDGSNNAVKHGTVYGIPWTRGQGGKNAVVTDPEVGDIGYVVVSDRDISNVKASKKQSNPGSGRKYNIADGVYCGGALNVAPDQYLVFTADGVRLVDKNKNSIAMSPDGVIITDKTGNVVSMAAGGIEWTPKAGLPVTVNANLVVKGNIMSNGTIQAEDGTTYTGNLFTTGEIASRVNGAFVSLSSHLHAQAPDGHGDAENNTTSPIGST